LVTADFSSLFNSSAGLTAGDIFLAERLDRKGREDLAGSAVENELARRVHFGLASRFSMSEVRSIIQAVLLLRNSNGKISEEKLGVWMEKEADRGSMICGVGK
jgi:hypothetical protein